MSGVTSIHTSFLITTSPQSDTYNRSLVIVIAHSVDYVVVDGWHQLFKYSTGVILSD